MIYSSPKRKFALKGVSIKAILLLISLLLTKDSMHSI